MKKSTMVRLLTLPFWKGILEVIWIVEENPESVSTFLQAMPVYLTTIISVVAICAAFVLAHECDVQDAEVEELKAKKESL